MRANRAYRMAVRRSGRAPALMADPTRIDQVEVVEIDSGEVVLFWDCDPREASRLGSALRTDLARLDADEFLAAWSEHGDEPDGQGPPGAR